MSANLLRRAARTLRQRVQGLPIDWKERWEVITTDSESLSGVAPEHPGHTGDTHWPCDRCEHFETYREGIAAYVRLLDPLVADALAAWLDDAAKDAEARVIAEVRVGMQPGDLVSPREELAVRLARAICRTTINEPGPVSTSPETGPRVEIKVGDEWKDITSQFNPDYRFARCGQLSAHGPHVMEHGPDVPRNCPGTGTVRLVESTNDEERTEGGA